MKFHKSKYFGINFHLLKCQNKNIIIEICHGNNNMDDF